MAKHPNHKPKSVQQNDSMTGAMKLFLAGCAAELYLLIVRRYYINGTISQVVAWDDYLKYFACLGLAVLAVGALLSVVWRADAKKRCIGWCTAGAGAFLAAASILVRMNLTLLSLMIVVVPVAMILGVVWSLYDRECALSLTVLGVSMLMVWAARRTIYSGTVKLLVVLFLLLLAAVVCLVWQAMRAGGKLGRFQFLPAKASVRTIYVSCGLSLAAVAAVLINTTIAYYAMWLLAAVVFALAVYYTVKQL